MIAAKTDSNQRLIVAALRKAGCSVELLHRVGGGVPDLLVGRNGSRDRRNYLLEVKAPTGKLNEEQEDWHAAWRGQVCTVRSVPEALEAVGAKDKGHFVEATLRTKEAKNGA